MMTFLQSFSLHDLLIFSPESYFKLFEISNKALWPLHIPLGLLVIAALALIYKRQRYTSRLILIWLSLVWIFVGYSYFGVYFSQIGTYAEILSRIFWAQAFLLFGFALFTKHESTKTDELSKQSKTPELSKASNASHKKWHFLIATSLIFYGIIIHPFVSLAVWNQPFSSFEFFSIAPDPTAIASIGFILFLQIRAYLFLIAIPILWLFFSIMTYQAF